MPRSNVEDWSTLYDFDPPGVRWLDCTTLGDKYEIQLAVNRENLYRHRMRLQGAAWIRGNPNDEV